jgi:NAD+ kinase
LAERLERVAVVTHEKPGRVRGAMARLEAVARETGVQLVDDDEAELAVVLGGDGTILRALQRFLGTGVPVFGVNFGRVGFLASVEGDELEQGVRRAFAGELRVVELATLEVELEGRRRPSVNDVVALSATRGRMVELGWAVGDEDLGVVPCDGIICATPSGSTAYNLSNGGPVLMWGLDAMAITFIAPHKLDARPLVLPRSRDVRVENRTPDVPMTIIVDGHPAGDVACGGSVTIRLGEPRSLLATLPEVTFFRRYRDAFAS